MKSNFIFNLGVVVTAVGLLTGVSLVMSAPTQPPPDGNPSIGGTEYWDSNGTDVFRSSGNLGIGTTSPEFQVDTSISGKIGNFIGGLWSSDNTNAFWGNNALDQTQAENYALRQAEDGSTYLNAPGGANDGVSLNIDDQAIAQFESSGATFFQDVAFNNNVDAPGLCINGICKTSTGTNFIEQTVVTNVACFGNTSPVTASCPAGWTRTGCSGYFNQFYFSSGDFGGAVPNGNIGCTAHAIYPGGGCNYVYAHCAR